MKSIILVEPQNAGNIGAIARVMNNFNYASLALINPQANHLSDEALNRAVHAKKILHQAKIIKEFSDIRKNYSYLIGTTCKAYSDRKIARLAVTPYDLIAKIRGIEDIAIIFGREDRGLSNTELLACDAVIRINTSKNYASMNVSHAAAIILYELSKNKSHKFFKSAGENEKIIINNCLKELIDATELRGKNSAFLIIKKVFDRAGLFQREARAIAGTLKKILKVIRKS